MIAIWYTVNAQPTAWTEQPWQEPAYGNGAHTVARIASMMGFLQHAWMPTRPYIAPLFSWWPRAEG